MKSLFSSLILATALGCALPSMAQTAAKVNSSGGNSPHETTSVVIDGNRVTLTYGRPYAKGRKIWGSKADKALVPNGEVWRTGSDEATILITQQPIMLGGAAVPPGAYTLRTLPNDDGTAKLIINKQIGQWGIGRGSYDEKQDVARVDMTKTELDNPVEQFTMSVDKNPAGGGAITMKWEKTQYSVAFTVQH